MAKFGDKDEIKIILGILRKAGIDCIDNILVSISNRATDIDILGVVGGNIVFLIECVGTDDFGAKLDKTIQKFNDVISNFEAVVDIVKKKARPFFNKNRHVLNSNLRLIVKIIVTLNKEEKANIDNKHSMRIKENDFHVWTDEERHYYERVADCTYDHCRYEIYGDLKLRPAQIQDERRPHILTYLAYGKKIDDNTYILNVVTPVTDMLKRSTIKRLQDTSTESGYQRLLNPSKLFKMREYLLSESKLYPNNIICVLNQNATIKSIGSELDLVNESHKTFKSAIEHGFMDLYLVQLPDLFDSFEIVDGQHRLFSYAQTKYHECESNAAKRRKLKREDTKITRIANQSSLIVTAIFSKNNYFGKPSKLFFMINTTQTKINPEDIIDIMSRFYPKTVTAKSNRLLMRLNSNGQLRNKIRVKFWHKARIKRKSLIEHSGFKDLYKSQKHLGRIFENAFGKQSKISDYTDYCFIIINAYLVCLVGLLRFRYRKTPWKVNYMLSDCTARRYYLFSAVFIGALIRLLGHFMSEDEQQFSLLSKIDGILNPGWKTNINNKALSDLFGDGLSVIAEGFTFTRKEFGQKKNWGFNKWRQIEADLFYLVKRKYKNFGVESLIAKEYRR